MKLHFGLILLLGALALNGCAQKQTTANNRYESGSLATVDDKYSLSADRSKLEELRKEVKTFALKFPLPSDN